MKKYLIAFIILFLLIGGLYYYKIKTPLIPVDDEPLPAEENLLGGDRDEHGCIPSAGYSWCEAKQKCLRPWEEECEEVPAFESENVDAFDENKVSL